MAILLGLSLNLALCLRRARDDLGVAVFVVVSHLNLFAAPRRDPPLRGHAARGRARLAVWLMTTTGHRRLHMEGRRDASPRTRRRRLGPRWILHGVRPWRRQVIVIVSCESDAARRGLDVF